MKKVISTLAALGLVCTCAMASADVTGSYTYHVQGDDWGCGVDKAIITLSEAVQGLNAENLTVTESKASLDWATFSLVAAEAPRKVLAVYACDAEGNAVEGASQYAAVELNIDPNEGSPLLYKYPYNVWCDPYQLLFTLNEGAEVTTAAGEAVTSLAIDADAVSFTSSTDVFEYYTADAVNGNGDAIVYNCATYTPANDSKTLVVWLHGMGEGASGIPGYEGTDARIPLLGAEVTALASDEFQSVMGGAHVLAPQCPTMWMDAGSGELEGLATSTYTESLHQLIADYKEKIGAEKVIISGCSNGGYMTMMMAVTYGDEYTAYVPVCEALSDEYITDEQIAGLAKLPMFFIYSEDDTTVDPTVYEIPTLARIQEAQPVDLQVFTTPHVYDTTGRFSDMMIWFQNEEPGTYMGHWSWIYFFNNTAVSQQTGETVWSWMAAK